MKNPNSLTVAYQVSSVDRIAGVTQEGQVGLTGGRYQPHGPVSEHK